MRSLTISVENCAAICHEANRAYCLYVKQDYAPDTWDEASESHKNSMRNGVRASLTGITPEQQHEAWRLDKKGQGWKYGPFENAAKKEHPSMLPYEKLSPAEKMKDVLFQAIVNTFTEKT